MATPARSDPAKPVSARIDNCDAAFHVTRLTGPLSSPETLLAAVRREILPALSDVLDAPEWDGIDIRADRIEIDLGHWPDDPVWSDVRYVLATKLRYALADYLPPAPTASGPRAVPAKPKDDATSHATLPKSESDPADDAQVRTEPETDQPTALPQQIADHIDAFMRWTQAASGNKTLPKILARLDRRSAESQALRHILRAASSADAKEAQTLDRRLTGELAHTVSRALTLLETRTEHAATQDAPSGQQSGHPQAGQPDQVPVTEASNAAATTSPPDIARDLHAALNGSDAFSLRLTNARKHLIHGLLQAGVPGAVARERSFALLHRLLPFLDIGSGAASLVSPEQPQTAAEVARSQASPEKSVNSSTVSPTTPSGNLPQAKGAHGAPEATKAHQIEPRQNSQPDASEVRPPEPERDRAVSNPSPSQHETAEPAAASDEADALMLTEIAQALGIRPGETAKDVCIAQLMQSPTAVFDAASDLGALNVLVRLLAQAQSDAGPLLAKAPLEADSIAALFASDPATFAKAVAQLTTADAFALARRLLPPGATLLIAHLSRLRDSAKSPRLAMQQAVLALLNGDLLDFEDLAQRVETPAEKMSPAERTGGETTAEEDGATERENPSDPDPEAAAQPHLEKKARTTGSLAETVMILAGFHPSEIERILARPANGSVPMEPDQRRSSQTETRSETSDPTKAAAGNPETGAPPDQPAGERSDADLIARAAALSKALAAPDRTQFSDAAELLLRAWPMVQPTDETALRTANLRTALTLLLARDSAQLTLSEYLLATAQEIEPDAQKRQSALRVVAARLSIPIGADETALRRQTHSAIEALLETTPQPTPLTQTDVPEKPPETDSETLLVTEVAGLVLLGPFFTLLFERLKIEWDGKALHEADYPKALGALHCLADTTPGPTPDPFHRVILGLDAASPLLMPLAPDEDAQALMDGLLRSVVARWGKLGATSPDGLRETFLRRTGTLRFDETGTHLRVTPGPFDMLLDGLPWSIDRLVLPWMPLPCHVTWREDPDA